MTTFLRYVSYLVIIIGVGSLIYYWYFLYTHNIILTPDGQTPDMSLTGNIGDFVGGTIGTILTLGSAILVIVTLQEQEKQNTRDRFAQSFYEMLHLHRENVSELSLEKTGDITLKGRLVFAELINEYTRVYKLMDSYCINMLSCTDSEDIKNIFKKIKRNGYF